jgi:asparagine synthase (glutamine-hydrolysing)
MRRTVVNPMLDHRFLDIVRSAPPTAKRNARLLSRILVELDPDLANVPMDGRPAPIAYSRGGFRSVATSVGVTTRKIAGKVRQRVEGRQRPPVGAPVLAALVLDHWRSEPSTLDPIRPLAIVDERWLDEVVLGDGDPPVTAVSLLTSLLAATGA